MINLHGIFIGVILSLFILPQASPPPPANVNLLARLKPAATTAERSKLLRSVEAAPTGQIPQLDILCLTAPADRVDLTLARLKDSPAVLYAEEDSLAQATLLPNDPGWERQWGLRQIQVPLAWKTTTGSPDIIVAVLDSGITLNHPDLINRLWVNPAERPANGLDDDGNGQVDDVYGWRFSHQWDGQTYAPVADGRITDDYGHGTHVAGIVGAEMNNGLGLAGMAPGSRLMTIKVLDQYGVGWYSDIAQGIVYAVDNGAKIINLSLGGKSPSETLQTAVDYAYAHGVLVVAAAGNDGGTVLYPAANEHTLAVAATDQNDARPSFSNHGPQVDVAAPGVDIYSTWPWVGGYFTKSGTSMATPYVAGLAALMWSVRPDLTVDQVNQAITSTAVDVNAAALPGRDEYIGRGRIDAAAAIRSITTAQTEWLLFLPFVLKRGNE